MDQSFNDQELSDIMKEIEALEEDFAAQATASPEEGETNKEESVGSAPAVQVQSEDSEESPIMESEEVLQDLAKMEETESVPLHNVRAFEPKESSHVANGAKSKMSFKVQGDLIMELNFEMGGKVVCLNVSESSLTIEMDGGMKFTLPVSKNSEIKKAV